MPRAVLPALALLALAGAALAGPGAPPPEPPWLGVGIGPGAHGVKITEVIEDTPADRAGLRPGDEIVAIDRAPLRTTAELLARVGARKPGDRVRLDVVRGKRRLVVRAVLAPRLDDQEVLERRLLDRPAPTFTLPVAAGGTGTGTGTVDLAALRGKVVVLEFLATWCGPCRTTYRPLSELQARRAGDGLVVLGISDEGEAALRALAGREPISFPLLRDDGGAVRTAYRAPATPTLVVIDREGVVRFVGLGAGLPLDHAVFAAERALGRPGGR